MRVDPITFEILRHRLWMINDEQGNTAIRISGSPVVYEIKDFSATMLTPEGDSLFVGPHVTRLSITLQTITKNILESYLENPGIRQGDMFITNDPWAGAAHPNDFALVSPIFWEGKLVCWTGIAMHEIDVGGPVPGSFCVGAKDAYGEAPLIPPLKIVEGGVIRKDIETMILRNVRTREFNALDLRASIAAQNMTRDRIYEVISQYGLETFLATQQEIINHVGKAVRRRLLELPDVEVRGNTLIDHNGIENKLYRICLALRKIGDRLILDFRGTDEQAVGVVNCAPAGLYGGIYSALLPMLCYDLPWTPGALGDIVEVISEEGTINNAVYPAAVGVATVSAIWATGNLVRDCLARVYACAGNYRKSEVQAGWHPGYVAIYATARDSGGDPRTTLLTFHAGGGGARSFEDGLDTSGPPASPGMSMPNVESLEKDGMYLVVYRKQRPDTAGAGMFRGGLGVEGMAIPYRITGGDVGIVHYSQGHYAPMAKGLFGGYPASVQGTLVLRGANLLDSIRQGRIPGSFEEAACQELETLQSKVITSLDSESALVSWFSGGGGYGDPLDRDLDAIDKELLLGTCTPEIATRVYGAVIGPKGRINYGESIKRRSSLKRKRVEGGKPVGTPGREALARGRTLREIADCMQVSIVDGCTVITCAGCGYVYGRGDQDPRLGAAFRDIALEEASPLNKYAFGKREFAIREFFCPICGSAISAELAGIGDEVAQSLSFAE